MKTTKDFLSRTDKIAIFHTSKVTYRHRPNTQFKDFANFFDAEYFGVHIFFDKKNGVVRDESGDELCTVDEYNSREGALNIDWEYNTYFWKPVKDLEIEDIECFVYGDFGISVDFNELYYLMGQPDSIKLLMDLEAEAETIAEAVYHSYSTEDLIENSIIEESEEEGEFELY